MARARLNRYAISVERGRKKDGSGEHDRDPPELLAATTDETAMQLATDRQAALQKRGVAWFKGHAGRRHDHSSDTAPRQQHEHARQGSCGS